MKILKIVSICLFLMLAGMACGGSSPAPQATASQQSPAPRAQTEQTPQPVKKRVAPPRRETFPVISGVKFLNPPRANTDLEVEVTLEKPDPEVRLNYRWFVNDKEVVGVQESVLPAHHFSGGDWVHCRVTAIREDRESRMVKSKYILIRSAPPVLELEPIPEFSVPGTFEYRIIATDPDAYPGDESQLTFELISPKDLGIDLNPQTGEIKWEINQETIKKLKEKIEITFKVIKKGAPEVQSAITLTFSDTGEEGEQEVQE